jgi:hypothetical protein
VIVPGVIMSGVVVVIALGVVVGAFGGRGGFGREHDRYPLFAGTVPGEGDPAQRGHGNDPDEYGTELHRTLLTAGMR